MSKTFESLRDLSDKSGPRRFFILANLMQVESNWLIG